MTLGIGSYTYGWACGTYGAELTKLAAYARDRHNPQVGIILEQWTPIGDTVENAIVEQERWADTGLARRAL